MTKTPSAATLHRARSNQHLRAQQGRSVNRGGFTLIETLIAVAVLVMMAALIAPSAVGLRSRLAFDQTARDVAELASQARWLARRDSSPYELTIESDAAGTQWLRVRSVAAQDDAEFELADSRLPAALPPAAEAPIERSVSIVPGASPELSEPWQDPEPEGAAFVGNDWDDPEADGTSGAPNGAWTDAMPPAITLASWDARGLSVGPADVTFRNARGLGFRLVLSRADGRPRIEQVAPPAPETSGRSASSAEAAADPLWDVDL